MHGAKKVYGMNLVDQKALDVSCTTSIHTRSLARINYELTQYPELNAQYISTPNHTGIISLYIASEQSNLRTSIAAHVDICIPNRQIDQISIWFPFDVKARV